MAYLVVVDDEVIAQYHNLGEAEAHAGEYNAMRPAGEPTAGVEEDCDN